MVGKSEQMLLNMGLKQVRVRHHNNLAKIETDKTGFEILMDKKIKKFTKN
jgi:uncharacterized protein